MIVSRKFCKRDKNDRRRIKAAIPHLFTRGGRKFQHVYRPPQNIFGTMDETSGSTKDIRGSQRLFCEREIPRLRFVYVYLLERKLADLAEVARLAELFLTARKRQNNERPSETKCY